MTDSLFTKTHFAFTLCTWLLCVKSSIILCSVFNDAKYLTIQYGTNVQDFEKPPEEDH